MSNYDFKGVIQAISDASPSHLALVSFLVFPVVMDYWLKTFMKIFPEVTSGWKLISLGLLVLVYLFCLWWLVKENNKKKQVENRKDKIIGLIMSKGFTKIGFDKLDQVFDPKLTYEEITEVIDSFPRSLRFVRLKKKESGEYIKDCNGNQVYKPGVGLIALKDDSNETDS